jgi:hypothetical protein
MTSFFIKVKSASECSENRHYPKLPGGCKGLQPLALVLQSATL